jgi:hypothetical protein
MGYRKGYRPVPETPDGTSQLDWCLANPPAPGITHEADERPIEIAGAIRVGEACEAQVVLTADGFVAKIYDPLFYKFPGDRWSNVTDSTDRDYITEAAAYSELLGTSIQGSIMPMYHGSWTLSVPLQTDREKQFREVRLILMEYVHGKSMLDVDPLTLDERERENIMTKLIEADINLRFSGVRHDDLEPRNVMLAIPDAPTQFSDQSFRLCIIDFAYCALLKGHDRVGPHPLVRNPLHYWAGDMRYTGMGWLPPEGKAIEWMRETWGNGGKEGKYVVVEKDPDDKFGRPKFPIEIDY